MFRIALTRSENLFPYPSGGTALDEKIQQTSLQEASHQGSWPPVFCGGMDPPGFLKVTSVMMWRSSQECLAELERKDQCTHGLLTANSDRGLCEVIDCSKFSSLDCLLAMTGHVPKFCKILLSKIRSDISINCDQAEKMWIRESQRTLLTDANFNQWRRALSLFQDDEGIWRCRGRLQNATIPYSTMHPMLLHRNHHLTLLVVQKAHRKVLHNGVSETLAKTRARFWILKGRSFVKSVIHRCHICRHHEGPPYSAPSPPPLPKFCVEEAPAFSFTGVDFAGPLYIKGDGESKEVWICLYTCLVVRAMHSS